jgi:hypothetical protein
VNPTKFTFVVDLSELQVVAVQTVEYLLEALNDWGQTLNVRIPDMLVGLLESFLRLSVLLHTKAISNTDLDPDNDLILS